MAFTTTRRTAAAVASVLAAVAVSRASAASAEATCPGASPMMSSAVVTISPACFVACPALCGVIDDMLTEYLAAEDKAAMTTKLQGQVCTQKKEFGCIFGNNLAVCQPVLNVGKSVVSSIPASQQELETQCSTTNAVQAAPKEMPLEEGQDVAVTTPVAAALDVQNSTGDDNATARDTEMAGDEADANQTTTKENSDSAHTTRVLAPVLVAVVASLARA